MWRESETERIALDVADGRPINWDEVGASAGDERDKAILQQLAAIAAVRDRTRTIPIRAPLAFGRHTLDATASVILALAALRLAFAFCCFAALAIVAQGWPPQIPVAFLAVAAMFTGSGAILLRQNRADGRAAELGLVFLLVATSFANGLYGSIATRIPFAAGLLQAFPADCFLAYAFWRFVRRFPTTVTGSAARRVDVLVRISLVAALVLLGATTWSVMFEGTGWGQVAQRLARRSAKGTIYWTVVFGLLAPAIGVLAWRVWRAGPAARSRGSLFLAGLVIGLLPLSLNILLETASSSYRQFSAAHRTEVFWTAITFLLTIPVSTTYAVLVTRVLDVRVVVRRTLRYALARTTLSAATLLPFGFIAHHVYQQRDLPVAVVFGNSSNIQVAVLLLVSGAALLRLRQPLLGLLDRLFFRSTYDPAEALSAILEESRRSATLTEICDGVVERVRATLKLSSAGVLVADDTGALSTAAGRVAPLGADSALAVLVAATAKPLYVNLERAGPLRRLPEEDLFWLADNDVQALVPIHGPGERLLGVLTLGAAMSDEPLEEAHGGFIAGLGAGLSLPIQQRLNSADPETLSGAGQALRGVECIACGRVLPGDPAVCTCGGRTTPSVVPHSLAGKFTVVNQLGRGGMGVVYRALDTALGRTVAIKTLPRIAPEHAARLRREARTMATLAHPNLATLFGLETWRGTPMLVVEYLPGGTLADRLRHGPFELADWLPVAYGILEGLAHVHGKGLLHRDLKPSNIGFTAEGVPKLLDFGLAQLAGIAINQEAGDAAVAPGDRNVMMTDRRVGTPVYMSPEAIRGESPDAGFDLWAFAVVMLEALTGRALFTDPDSAIAQLGAGRLPMWRHWTTAQSPQVIALLEEALDPDRSRRPPHAGAFVDRLRSLVLTQR
jgi:hypothetical protein